MVPINIIILYYYQKISQYEFVIYTEKSNNGFRCKNGFAPFRKKPYYKFSCTFTFNDVFVKTSHVTKKFSV